MLILCCRFVALNFKGEDTEKHARQTNIQNAQYFKEKFHNSNLKGLQAISGLNTFDILQVNEQNDFSQRKPSEPFTSLGTSPTTPLTANLDKNGISEHKQPKVLCTMI